jgi:outer membrane protein OmpA-like peptidoglycan-associated protein
MRIFRFVASAAARPLAVALAVALAGCAGTAPRGAAPGASAAVSLPAEQRRLADLFRGTPVVFAMQADGSLRVTVPLQYAFDKGRFAVKPPLAAVLVRLARSQRTESTRWLVAAPADPQSKGLMLATERATSTRDYLVGHGIEATRFSIAAAGGGDAIVIVIAQAAPH